MTASPLLRPGRPGDLAAIEGLAADIGCIRWGWLPRLTSDLLAERWRQPKVRAALIQVAETADRVQGYSDIYQASPALATLNGIAANLDVARALIGWACEETASRAVPLQTSLFGMESGRTLRPDVVDRPVYSLLAAAGFRPTSTTRIMRLGRANTPTPQLPRPYRLASFNESLLPSLLSTYYATWPTDYYGGDDTADIARIFRQASDDDLYLALAGNSDEVAGYVLASRTPELGVIDEVAVHPAHRRKGLGAALVLKAIQSLGDRTITLVVMDDNPARRLHERLGFALWEERVDLLLATR